MPLTESAQQWTDSVAPIDCNAEIFRDFLRAAEHVGDNIALVDSTGEWTYAETRAAALLLARTLRSQGVGVGDIVIVVPDRCAAFALILLGVLIAGARFFVLDRTQSDPAYLAAVARLLGPRCWLTLRADAAEISRILCDRELPPVPIIELPAEQAALRRTLEALGTCEQSIGAEIPARLGGRAPAYLIATSGTTGTPKIVSTRHQSVVNFLRWYADAHSLRADDRFSLLSGLAHDPVLRDVFAPLSVGATLCVPSEAQRKDPDALAAWLREAEITVAHLTPPIVDMLARARDQTPQREMRLIASGGDMLTRRHAAALAALFPSAELINCYGATETPQFIASHRVSTQDACAAGDTLPIGRSVPGWQLLLLDAAGAPCRAGEVGEIQACSEHLAEGYVGHAEATAERFLSVEIPGMGLVRMFRTGDLGVQQADGAIRLIGRRDRQVKIQGHRVDLADVEAEIAAFAAVAQAAVTFDAGRAELTAYVVPTRHAEFSRAELLAHLARTGRTHAMPAQIIVVGSLPLTSNGKIDRAALLALKEHQPIVMRPRDESGVLELLRQIWAEELPVAPRLGSETFQELGGDSIRAAKIAARVQRTAGVTVRPMDLFVHPTLAAFAAFVGQSTVAFAMPGGKTDDDIERRRSAVRRMRQVRSESNG